MHLVNFARPDIADFVRANFEILQLNISGDRSVTDFDGDDSTEKETRDEIRRPFHADIPVLSRDRGEARRNGAGQARGRPHARLPPADDFLAMFRFVREKAYDTKSLRDFPEVARELTA